VLGGAAISPPHAWTRADSRFCMGELAPAKKRAEIVSVRCLFLAPNELFQGFEDGENKQRYPQYFLDHTNF
jgi:hypothetical protein